MNKIFFWLEWPKAYRMLYTLGLLLLLASLSYAVYAFWQGNTATIHWESEGSLDIAQAPIDYFRKHFFEFPIQADTYILVEKFLATDFQLNYWAYYIHFGLIVLGLLMILTAISDLTLTYYGLGLVFVILFIANMQLELLQLGDNISDRWMLMVIFVAYAPLSYLYYAYWTSTSYFLRFTVYSTITVAIFYYASQQTALEAPAFHLIGHSMIFPLIAVGAICLFVGHEPIRALLFIVTNGATQASGRMRKLWVLSILYFGNLIYGIVHLNYQYDLGIYYLHPFVLLIISIFLGVWGLRERAEQIHPIMAFAPTGAFLYLGLAILATSMLSFAIASNNESLWAVLQDAVLYSHLTLGIAFIGYIHFNFKELIQAGKKVHRVIYRPKEVSYLVTWAFGVMLIIGLLLGDRFFMYDQSLAAYHTIMADAALAEGDQYTAKQYYNIAKTYDPLSHRLHYSLGSIARQENNKDASYFFFKGGQEKWPSPHAYANMSRLNEKQGFSFEALFDLKEGVKKFPENGELLNNLALMYNETDLADSAYIYFQLARTYAEQKEIVESNLFSLWTKYDFYDNLDSIYTSWEPSPYVGTAANELAFLTKMGKTTDKPLDISWLQDSVLLTPNLCYVYNYALNTAKLGDTTALPYLEKFVTVFDNETFDLYLHFAISHIKYQQGRYKDAFFHLKSAYNEAGRTNGYFSDLLGLRYLEHEQYEESVSYLEKAYARGYEPALLHLAIASSELADKSAAVGYWKQLRQMPKKDYQEVALDMLRLLVPDSLPKLNLKGKGEEFDILRYRYLHYNQQVSNEEAFSVIENIANTDIRGLALAERVHHALDLELEESAGLALANLMKVPLTDFIQPYFEQAYLRFTHYQNKLDEDFFGKVQEATYPPTQIGLKHYYMASYYQKKGAYEEAVASYRESIDRMPYLAEAYIGYSKICHLQKNENAAYNVLLEAIRSNPENRELLEAYILYSEGMSLSSFVESAFKKLAEISSDAEYQAFMALYKVKKAEMEKAAEDWQ